MLAQFGQQTRCCGFPFFKLKNDPDAVDPQSGRSQIPTLSSTLPKMEKGCKHFYHVSPCSLPHRCVLYVLPSQNKTASFNPKILVWMAIEECTCSCPHKHIINSSQGGVARQIRIHWRHGWGGGGLWGGWLACSVHVESRILEIANSLR